MTNGDLKAVKKGAALLDRERPGWRDEIDTVLLSMGSTRHCVLGQLYSVNGDGDGFNLGLERLKLRRSYEAQDYGFDLDYGYRDDYDALTNAWVAEIREALA